jgi:hypothetical protein
MFSAVDRRGNDRQTSGAGVGNVAKSSGGLFFVWTLVALGALATFSFLQSVRGLWSKRSGQSEPR